MKEVGYGKGYKYAHSFENATTDMNCFPEDMVGTVYYEPTERGFEGKLKGAKR